MIDHISTYATDFERSKAFYDAVLAPLGASLQMEMVASWDEACRCRLNQSGWSITGSRQ